MSSDGVVDMTEGSKMENLPRKCESESYNKSAISLGVVELKSLGYVGGVRVPLSSWVMESHKKSWFGIIDWDRLSYPFHIVFNAWTYKVLSGNFCRKFLLYL